jgi:glycosyltransferase involved in cell wall biosynthesis
MPAKVIYPPVSVDTFQSSSIEKSDDFFLIIGRFLNYKHYDIVIKAFRQNGRRLKVVGTGPEEQFLHSLADRNSNIEFCGRLDDSEAHSLFQTCRAVIFPSEDDFGIVPVESMSAGKPVIAYRQGGALETVVEGVTGMFFREQTPESLNEILDIFDTMNFDSNQIKSHAQKFSQERFVQEMDSFIRNTYNQYQVHQ